MRIKHQLISLFFSPSSKQECHRVLAQWNTYYNGLSDANKRSFIIRTLLFQRTTSFDSETGFPCSMEMQLVISSAFVQITFGLRQDVLDIFKSIFVTPSAYSYKEDGPLFDGDVNPFTKRVNLSWPAVENGFVVNNDGMNLAIHEFGHCLLIENFRRSYLLRIFNERDLRAWKKIATNKMPRVREGNHQIIREYGGRNLMELFAVTLEIFFEQPHELYSSSPRFYQSTCKLLKQDPRNAWDPKSTKV